MQIIHPPGVVQGFWRALLSSLKRPASVQSLPSVAWQCEVVVDGAHLNAYNQLCGFNSGALAPLTYPQSLTTPLVMAYVTSRHCPWPAMGTVHLANAITQHHAVQVGEALIIQLKSGKLWAHDKGQAYTLHLSILRKRDRCCLWQATQTLLRVGVSKPQGQPWEEAQASTSLQRVNELIAPADIGRRYARVSQDYNPIHWSAVSARWFGQPSAIAHGLWTQARALALLHPDGVLQAASLTTQFKRPLRLPAQATLWVDTAQTVGYPSHDTATAAETPVHFEVRDASGQQVHLRAGLQIDPPNLSSAP
jgi:acyl dehydratase